MQTGLDKAITAVGSQAALAQMIGISKANISQWKSSGLVPARHCRAIERITGGIVQAHELNPEVFGGS